MHSLHRLGNPIYGFDPNFASSAKKGAKAH